MTRPCWLTSDTRSRADAVHDAVGGARPRRAARAGRRSVQPAALGRLLRQVSATAIAEIPEPWATLGIAKWRDPPPSSTWARP